MVTPSQQPRATLADLTRLYKENRIAECRAALKQIQDDQPDFFQKLLWIGQISENYDEANHAAELALAIKPTDEIAQRVIVRVQERFPQQIDQAEIDVMRLTGMTINQARAVNWPFRGVNRPVGNLLDEKAIKINDLAFAADNAYDATLKKAATTLLLDYLLQGRTAQPPAPLTLLKGPSFAGSQVRINALYTGLIFGAFFTLLLVVCQT